MILGDPVRGPCLEISNASAMSEEDLILQHRPDIAEALEISRHGPLTVSPRVIVAASPASSFSSETSSSGAELRDLVEASEKAKNYLWSWVDFLNVFW